MLILVTYASINSCDLPSMLTPMNALAKGLFGLIILHSDAGFLSIFLSCEVSKYSSDKMCDGINYDSKALAWLPGCEPTIQPFQPILVLLWLKLGDLLL